MRPDKHRLKGWQRFNAATGNSLRGLKALWKSEEAFRLECIFGAVLIPATFFLDLAIVERVLLVGSFLILLMVEMLNTAIEIVVDRIGTERNELSGMAKDIASTAVMFAMIFAGMVWGLIIFF